MVRRKTQLIIEGESVLKGFIHLAEIRISLTLKRIIHFSSLLFILLSWYFYSFPSPLFLTDHPNTHFYIFSLLMSWGFNSPSLYIHTPLSLSPFYIWVCVCVCYSYTPLSLQIYLYMYITHTHTSPLPSRYIHPSPISLHTPPSHLVTYTPLPSHHIHPSLPYSLSGYFRDQLSKTEFLKMPH